MILTTRKRPLERPRRRCEDDIKMDLKEIGINTRNWVDSDQGRDYIYIYICVCVCVCVCVLARVCVMRVWKFLRKEPTLIISLEKETCSVLEI